MQKHKVGQTISTLATWVNYLELARQLGKKEDSDVVIPAYNTTVGDIYSNIQDSLKTLQREIASLDSSYGLEKDAKTFALADFLDCFCNKSCPGYELIWNSQSHRYQQDLKHIEIDDRDPVNLKTTVYEDDYIIRAGDPMDYIHFPEKALETILENIIANAVAHGFTDPQKHYQIKFDIERDGTTVVLFVSNNGQPLHKDMVPAEVFTYGHTSGDEKHSGIGGYQILEYMRAFGGSAEIISTPDEEYSVTYKLTFKDANPSIQVLGQIEL
jgi:light-regulated signal transduction histidine kinase (bacteriophytochrome)